MNWIVPFIIGLIAAWLIQFLIDLFYWRQREVEGTANVDCSEIAADYEKEIEGLNLSLDNYKSNIEAKDVEISDLNASLEAKDVELAELSASLAALNADIEAKDRDLADLSASINAKDVEISGLSASIDGKNAELSDLSASLEAKNVEAEGLRGRLLGNIKSPGWFDWGEYDFFNWGEGDDVEFVGSGEAGETVDITYGRETVGTAEVDAGGNWKLPWAVPAAFLPSMLGFIRRDRDGAEVDASRGEMSAVIDAEAPVFPDIDADADIEVESDARSSWFSWPSLDFSGWRAGEKRELSGTGEPGGTVDVEYNGEVIESVPVDDGGRWSLSWLVPTGFAAGALSFLGRDRDGSEIDASADADIDIDAEIEARPFVEADVDLPSVDVDAESDASAKGSWFSWPSLDFSGWREGEDRYLSGTGEPGGSVDINYNGEFQGTAEVDDAGQWSWPFTVPALFTAGGLSYFARNRDGSGVEVNAPDVDMELPSADADVAVEASLPDVDFDATLPSADIDVDAEAGSSWFRWPDWDFSSWREGEEQELSGVGEPGGTVDVQYNGEVVGTAPVDDNGRWSLSWLVPAGFAAGGLGLFARDRDGAEVEVNVPAADAELPSVDVDVDASLPEVDIDASVPDVDADVDASAKGGWFNWPDWDFSGWGAGEDRELSGVGEPGGSVDVNYDGEYVGTAKVGDDGKWTFPFKVPALFAAGGLGFLARDRDGGEVEASAGADFDLDLPSADLEVDGSLPEVEVAASLPDVDADASVRGGWFNWPDWDFSGWRAGEERELSGIGEPGGTVDVQYNGEVVGTAPVDDDGRWSWSWLVPAGFAAGGLGFLGRNRDGVEVESSAGADFDLALSSMDAGMDASISAPEADASVDLGIAGAALAGAAAVGLGGAFVDLVNTTQTTVRLEDIEGDDLTKIWGIGPKTKLNFYRRGITTFEQFANIDPDTLAEIMKESRLMSARIPKDPHGDWTALADLAAKGDWDRFDALTAKIKPPEPKRKKRRKATVKLDGDKLSDIAGIGRGTWKALHGMGYNSYAKLADISLEEVEAAMKKSRALNAPGAPTPAEAHASWTELAGLAAAGDWNAFNARNAGLDTGVVTTPTQTSFDAMGYDFSGWEAGQQRSFNGNEAAGSVINFYYDGDLVGEAVAGDDGAWEFPFTVPDGFNPSLMTFTMS